MSQWYSYWITFFFLTLLGYIVMVLACLRAYFSHTSLYYIQSQVSDRYHLVRASGESFLRGRHKTSGLVAAMWMSTSLGISLVSSFNCPRLSKILIFVLCAINLSCPHFCLLSVPVPSLHPWQQTWPGSGSYAGSERSSMILVTRGVLWLRFQGVFRGSQFRWVFKDGGF